MLRAVGGSLRMIGGVVKLLFIVLLTFIALALVADVERLECGRLRTCVARGVLLMILGHSPLMQAARRGCAECVSVLVEHGAEVNLQHDWSGRGTALMFSATQGHVSVIERLIALGAEVDAENIGGATPLILAARDGHTAAVAALLAAGGGRRSESTSPSR